MSKVIKPYIVKNIATSEQIMQQLPIPAILASIEMQIKVLESRGVKISNWDNKSKSLKQVRMLGGKVYFFEE